MPGTTHPLRFGPFELDAARLELRREGRLLDVQPKALELLVHLVGARDRLVSKDELLSTLWPDTAISEASLSRAVHAVRQALGDDARASRYIQTVRGRGFRFCGEVLEPAHSAIPEVAQLLGGLEPGEPDDFVGRREVLEAIAGFVAAARGGAGRLVLLSGEAGMGKTRTSERAAARCQREGGDVALGWCSDAEGAPPLWPWLQLARGLAGRLDGPSLVRTLGDGLADLAELVPSLRPFAGDTPALPRLDPEQARFRLFDTLAQLLFLAARERPLLVILDDFHWADRASQQMLAFLAREVGESQLVVLVTHREEDLEPGHALLDLRRRPACETLRLAGLDREEVCQLMAAEIGVPVDETAASLVHERTDGNPYFVKELTGALAAEGRLDGASAADSDLPLPSGVREVLRARLARLPADTRARLGVGATVGRAFDLALVAAVTGEQAEELLAHLEPAQAQRVLQPAGRGYRFVHALVRDALAESIPAVDRARLHRRIGEALEERHAGDIEPHLSQLAYHFCAGAPSGGVDRAVQYARRAGERSAQHFAYDAAAAHFESALSVHPLLPKPDEADRCALLLALGEAQIGAGTPTEGRASLRRAVEMAQRLARPDCVARAALAMGGSEFSTEIGVFDPELIRLLESALEALPASDEPEAARLRLRLQVRLGIALWWSGAHDRCLELEREVTTRARTLGDPEALGYVLYGRRWTLAGPDDLRERLADASEMLEIGRRLGHRELELAGRTCRFLDLMEAGRVLEADRELNSQTVLASEVRLPRYVWRLRFYASMRAFMEGRFAEAEDLALQALAHGQRIELRGVDARASFGVQMAVLRREQGRMGELEAGIKNLIDRFPAVPAWRATLAFIHSETGRSLEAREALDRFAADGFRAFPRDFLWVAGQVLMAEVATELDDAERASQLYAILRPHAPRTVMIGLGVVCWGALDRYLGQLAATAGDWTAAERHLRLAWDANRELGAQPWVAWTDFEWARMLCLRGTPGDRDQARRHAERAGELAERLCMPRLASRVAALGVD